VLKFGVKTPVNKNNSSSLILTNLELKFEVCMLKTLFLLKVLVSCGKCSWFKVVILIFWKSWRSPTSLKPKIHCFLVGGTGGYSFYFLLNLQLK
jgi:hypothetical protein